MGASTEAGYFNRLIFTSIEMGASASIPFRVFENSIIMLLMVSCTKLFSGSLLLSTYISVSKLFFIILWLSPKNSPLQLLFRVDKRILLLSKHVGAVQLSIVYSC